MGRFAEESHTDLREWYLHCLDFLALKRRLIDDPPDPYDDHPSMAGPSSRGITFVPADVIDGSGCGTPASQTSGAIPVSLSDSKLEQRGRVLTAGNRNTSTSSMGMAVGEGAAGLEGVGVTDGSGAGDISVVFRDRSSRVFAFEMKQELDRLWTFYRSQSEGCAAKLSCLQDTSASARHLLHRKLGGSQPVTGHQSNGLLLDDLDLQYGGGGGGASSSAVSGGGCLRPTAQEELMLGNRDNSAVESGSKPRIRGRKVGTSFPVGHQDRAFSAPPVASAGASIHAAKTTEDPYVQATLKRSIVELYNTCHRLLSFKMLNYDACVRLLELHCRRLEFEVVSGGKQVGGNGVMSAECSSSGAAVTAVSGAAAGMAVSSSSLPREKAMKMWLLEHPVFSSRELNRTLAGVELLYASLFCNGDVDVARTALTFKASSSLRGNRRFGFGYRLGLATVLLIWAVWDCLIDDSRGKDVWHDPAFEIFRGLGNLVLLVYMWGVNLWVWRRFGIDYERCLSLDPKGPRVDPCEEVWNAGCTMSIVFLVCFISFYKALRGAMGSIIKEEFAHCFPLFLLGYMIFTFLHPWKERKALLYMLWTVIISPLGQVRFLEGYVGDILTSTVKVLIDVAFAMLYFACGAFFPWSSLSSYQTLAEGEQLQTSGNVVAHSIKSHYFWKLVLVPMITAGPLWWRFQQNLRRSYETSQRWPHLGNALKYATAMSVSLFGMYQPGLHTSWLWMFSFVVATLYQFTWDIAMDWDLLRWDGKSLRLRPRLLYRNKIAYVAVALVNLGLRFLWTVTLLPENTQMFSADFNVYMSPFIAAAEIIRRTMWGFLRVENEHLRIYEGSDIDGQVEEGCSDGYSSSTSSSITNAPLSGNGSASASAVGVGSGVGGGGSHRGGSGLDRLPYSRMEISASAGTGAVSRSVDAIKAWCLNRVHPESHRRLIMELWLFSTALMAVALVAALSRPMEEDAA